jgi:hypothetical protein
MKKAWWILPYLGGMAAVLVVAGAVLLIRHGLGGKHEPVAAATTQGPPMPAQMSVAALTSDLKQAMQTGSEQAFLSRVAPAAKPAVRLWWDNLSAIGFTTGTVIPQASGPVQLDSHGDATITVLAGFHSPLDPVDPNTGQPGIPCEQYRIGVHFTSGSDPGTITSWHPLGDAPWDQGTKLYVRKGLNVVVAGPLQDSAYVDETLPLAQQAAAFDVGLVNHIHHKDLTQQGFVVFVSPSPGEAGALFGGKNAGWPPEFLGARTVPLPGNVSTGGARVLVTPYEKVPGTDAHQETVTLVRNFMLDILAAHAQALIAGTPVPTVPTWTLEGLAVAVQALFQANTNPAPGHYSFSPLTTELRALPPSFRKHPHLPNDPSLYGPDLTSDQQWNDVAASAYEYIALKAGYNQLLASAMLMWTQYSTPFGNVLQSNKGGNYYFYTQSAMEKGWRAWLASDAKKL